MKFSLPSTCPPLPPPSPRNRALSSLQEQPRAIKREDTQQRESEEKSGQLSQQEGAAAAKTIQHFSVDATVTCQRPAHDSTTRLRQWLSMGACETALTSPTSGPTGPPLPQSAVQHPANPSHPPLSTDSPDKDDDSGAPDVVAHIIIRAVPDSVPN